MRFVNKKTGIIGVALASMILFGAESCDETETGEGQKTENKARQSNYDSIVKSQPSHKLSYSPTRATKNFWIDTWGKEKGKLSYVYFQNANGDITGYFVFDGLPVSYCVSLVPPYQIKDYTDSNGGNAFAVPGPSIDGTYSSGNNCNTFYGKDATTGAYIEYTAGLGINVLLYDQPLPGHPNVPPLGPTDLSK